MNNPAAATTSRDVALTFEPCWFNAPPERTAQFFPAFVRVSTAVQAALRCTLPETYLADTTLFRDTRMVYPLLIYAASRPYNTRLRTDFTYDILNPDLMRKFYFSVRLNLPRILADVNARLRAAGMNDLARQYRPERSADIIEIVNRLRVCRRRLEALLITETRMVNDLIRFSGIATRPEKERAQIAARCEKQWLTKLRRLWARRDYTALGPGILSAATTALVASPPPPS
jgi:hypothetical protein